MQGRRGGGRVKSCVYASGVPSVYLLDGYLVLLLGILAFGGGVFRLGLAVLRAFAAFGLGGVRLPGGLVLGRLPGRSSGALLCIGALAGRSPFPGGFVGLDDAIFPELVRSLVLRFHVVWPRQRARGGAGGQASQSGVTCARETHRDTARDTATQRAEGGLATGGSHFGAGQRSRGAPGISSSISSNVSVQ